MALQEDETVLECIKDIKDRNNRICLISCNKSEKKETRIWLSSYPFPGNLVFFLKGKRTWNK